MHNSLLIVDDSEDTRELFSVTLRFEGYQVQTAKSAQEALEMLRQNPDFTLILLDLRMPGMDGIRFLETLKNEDLATDIPVLLISAYEGLDRMKLPRNVLGTLKKPFFYPELLYKIKEIHSAPAKTESGLPNRLF